MRQFDTTKITKPNNSRNHYQKRRGISSISEVSIFFLKKYCIFKNYGYLCIARVMEPSKQED